jgi:hypothetical protein
MTNDLLFQVSIVNGILIVCFAAPRYKTQKFKEWLLSSGTADIKLSPFAMEILSYLAYETVAQVTVSSCFATFIFELDGSFIWLLHVQLLFEWSQIESKCLRVT